LREGDQLFAKKHVQRQSTTSCHSDGLTQAYSTAAVASTAGHTYVEHAAARDTAFYMFLMTSHVPDDLMPKQTSADCKQFALHTALQATSFVAQPLSIERVCYSRQSYVPCASLL
jgi:hypothetical protein